MAHDRRTELRPLARCPMSQHRWNHPPQDASELLPIDPLASGDSVPNGWKPASSLNFESWAGCREGRDLVKPGQTTWRTRFSQRK